MKYLFSALYVIAAIIILLNVYLLIITGWAWTPVIRIVIALFFIYANYKFMKQAYKDKRQSGQHKAQK